MESSAMSPGRSRSTCTPLRSGQVVMRFCQRSGGAPRWYREGMGMVFQHGIGGSQDLPISLPFALAGGAAALAVSFIVLALAWREPRFDAATKGRPLPHWLASAVDGGWLTLLLRIAGLAFAVYVTWAALAGPDNLSNPTFGVVYVLLWVGIVPAS